MKSLSPNTFLVALMNNKPDFLIAQNEHWYRIPTDKAPKNLREGIVKYIAFYQSRVFNNDKYMIRYYAKVQKIEIKSRKELFPDEPFNSKKSHKTYYKIIFESLNELAKPIPSHRGRRILFVPTTYDKFRNNEIESVAGWSVLRFPTVRLVDDMEHCIQTIQKRIYLYGGQKMPDGNIVQEFYKSPDMKQLNLF
jgi:hypothetical protein